MRLRLVASPKELEQKGDALIKALVRELSALAPDLAERLEKALPSPEQTLKFPALQGLADITREEYARTLERMIEDIGKVLDESTKPDARYIEKSLSSDDLEKAAAAGPFIGPRGGKWADQEHTQAWTPHVIQGEKQSPKVNAKKLLAGNAGIPRIEMPQIRSFLVPEFIQGLRDKGIPVTRGHAPVGKLKATQSEIHTDKVQELIDKPETREGKKPVIVSSDGYILDGHHRWAVLTTLDPNDTIETVEVGLPISKLLDEARGFHGVTFKKAEEPDEEFYDFTKPIADRDDRAYQRIKTVLQRKGYAASDFEYGGALYGYSVNELIELVHGKELTKAVAGPYIGPRGGKWADPEHTIPWHTPGAPEAAPAATPAKPSAPAPGLTRNAQDAAESMDEKWRIWQDYKRWKSSNQHWSDTKRDYEWNPGVTAPDNPPVDPWEQKRIEEVAKKKLEAEAKQKRDAEEAARAEEQRQREEGAGSVRFGRSLNEYPEPEWAKGKGAWRSESYSFGGDPQAKKLKSVEWESKMPKRWQALGAYDIRDALKAAIGDVKAPPGHQLVYRIGAGSDSLENRNAGNLEGVTDFLGFYTERDYNVQLGNQLTVYAIKMPDKFQPFQPYNKGAATKYANKAEEIEFGAVPARPPWPARKTETVEKAMYVGPRGGKWADPQHTRHWEPEALRSALETAIEKHGGKVSKHETDATKVMVKIPIAKIQTLADIKQHFHLDDEVKSGGKYAMLPIPKTVFAKIEAAHSAPADYPKPTPKAAPPPYAKAEWKPHTTVEEAKAWAKERGLDVAYTDVATANQLNRAVSEQHPWVQRHVEFLGTATQLHGWAAEHPDINKRAQVEAKHKQDLQQFSLGGSAIAIAHPTTGKPYSQSVVVVADGWGTAEQYNKKAKGFAKGFTLGGELVDTVRHEFGHVEGFIFRHLYPEGPGGPSAWEVWKKHCVAKLKADKHAVMADVSQYGATNPHECWAEVSVMRRRGMPLPGWIQSAIDEMKIDKVSWDAMGKVWSKP